jgi:probable F420-dependent oxidoreductase
MKFGAIMFPTDYSMSVVELGRALEERGFESLWVPEHTHIPTSRQTPWPGGAELPREYSHALDPFVALGAVAAATSQLRLGTGVCLVIEHDPIDLAKQVATLDLVSGGRFLFGIGGGWNREEMRHHGTDPAQRWGILRERIEAMKAIWTTDEAEYHGRFVNFDPIWSWPKPVQQPHPPILMGGDGPKAIEGLLEYCDEWMPRPVGFEPPLPERAADVQRRATELGRRPIPMTIFGAALDPRELERYEQLGATCAMFRVRPENFDRVPAAIERAMAVVREYRGE